MSIIEIKNHTVKVKRKTLLENLTVNFEPGEKYFIFGPNGSGKTTLLKDIFAASLVQSDTITGKGSISLSLADMGMESKSMTVYDFLEFNLQDDNDNWFPDLRPFEKFFSMGTELYQKPLTKLSGGEMRLIDLIMNFAKQTEVILIDELENNLDKQKFDLLVQYINTNLKASTIIFSTHSKELPKLIKGSAFLISNKQLIHYDLEKVGKEVFDVNFKFDWSR